MMTSESLKAQGKSIKRAALTGSLLRGIVRLKAPRARSETHQVVWLLTCRLTHQRIGC